jgi:hypothetical protein
MSEIQDPATAVEVLQGLRLVGPNLRVGSPAWLQCTRCKILVRSSCFSKWRGLLSKSGLPACLGNLLKAPKISLPIPLQGAERDAQAAADLRVQIEQQQAEVWEQAAGRLQGLREAQRERIGQARQLAEKVSG